MEKLIDISSYPIANMLDLLLTDKSTKKNIIWATDTYEELGSGFTDKEQIDHLSIMRRTDLIRPRIQKSQEAQVARTRKKAEVFTPAWLCNKMNNHFDEEWFGRKDVFNHENADHTWTVVEDKIEFPPQKRRKTPLWQEYVDSRRLEITCGEAPYLVSRYDVSTGDLITPPKHRIGQLDRKLRIVNENTENYETWLKWTIRAFDAVYGYEYQGDNLLIARINLLLTFVDYYTERWGKQPDERLLRQVANKIVWNIWQMDGLKDTVPLGKPYEEYRQMTLFDVYPHMTEVREEPETVPCKIFDWRRDNSILYRKLKENKTMSKKLFDFVIGNPPYNEDFSSSGKNGKFAKPVYNDFMDAAYEIANKVELIHPARFLFNAGSTPKSWNKKMLEDPHLKILYYETDAKKMFPNTDIKGGVAVTYYNHKANYGSIGTFIPFPELKSISRKVQEISNESFSNLIVSSYSYHFTKKLYEDYPDLQGKMSKGHDFDLKANVFKRLPQIFFSERPDDGLEYIGIYGLKRMKRTLKYVRKVYINDVKNLEYFKVFLSKSNGSGALGETLTTPLIGLPLIGHTESFISIGCFNTEEEAKACIKYVKTKFARCLLGILKVTQDNPPEKWQYVPLQDFTSNSDIDWSKSVHDIDSQLYRKYGLDDKEIDFIETRVKEMV